VFSFSVEFSSLKHGDAKDELMDKVVTEETVIKEYNPYKELGLMGQLTSIRRAK
jgi:hypothetical protein